MINSQPPPDFFSFLRSWCIYGDKINYMQKHKNSKIAEVPWIFLGSWKHCWIMKTQNFWCLMMEVFCQIVDFLTLIFYGVSRKKVTKYYNVCAGQGWGCWISLVFPKHCWILYRRYEGLGDQNLWGMMKYVMEFLVNSHITQTADVIDVLKKD